MAAKHFDVLSPIQFLEDIETEAKNAKSRIWAQAMEVEPGEYSGRLLKLVETAAEQGLDARLNVDYYSLLVTDGIPNYLATVSPGIGNRRLNRKKRIFQTITDKGGKVMYINAPTPLERLIFTMGRNHMKIFITDDMAWIGGVNFGDGYFKRKDIMVKITHKDIVDPIAKVFLEAHEGKLDEDEVLQTNNSSKLFIDSGNTGNSVILHEAVNMVKQAKQTVHVVTAFVPDGNFLQALMNADKRGVAVSLVVSDPASTLGIYRIVNTFSNLQLKRKNARFKIYYQKVPVHAKVLIVDERTVLFGSHNFLTKGVLMRTGEIALQSEDRTLVDNLLKFYQSVAQ